MSCSPTKSGSDTNLLRHDDFADKVTSRMRGDKRKRPDDDVTAIISEELRTFKSEIMTLLTTWRAEDENKHKKWDQTLTEIKNTTRELEKSMDFITSQYEEMSLKINGLEQKTILQEEVISSLKNEVEHLQRESRKTCLELRNVPAEAGENKKTLSDSFVTLCKAMSVDTTPSEIKDIYRIPGKREANKPVIIELATKEKKICVLKAAKEFNIQHRNAKLNASHLGLKQNTPIYVSDHLTPLANRLFFLARDLVKSNIFKYCWSSNGKIFVKKTDDTPIILIKSESQVHQLKSV